jgi:hypothetical protein
MPRMVLWSVGVPMSHVVRSTGSTRLTKELPKCHSRPMTHCRKSAPRSRPLACSNARWTSRVVAMP